MMHCQNSTGLYKLENLKFIYTVIIFRKSEILYTCLSDNFLRYILYNDQAMRGMLLHL